jgi:hypothetical protein
MCFNRFCLALFAVLMTLALTNVTFAKSVTMTFEGQHLANYISINGSCTPAMCAGFDDNIYERETWTPTATPFLQAIASSIFVPAMTPNYKATGLIYKSMLAGTLTTLQAKWAVRGLFSTSAQNSSGFTTYGGAASNATYMALAGTSPNSGYSGLILFAPSGGQLGYGPQEFTGNGAGPEPVSLTLLGTGLIALASAVRHMLVKA